MIENLTGDQSIPARLRHFRGALLQEQKNLASVFRKLRGAGFSTGNSIRVLKCYAAEAERLEEIEEGEV